MKKIHLVMPMSGQGTRYRKAGYEMPKPMIPVNGIPMVERLLDVFPPSWPAHFILAQNHAQTGLQGLLTKLRPTATIRYVPEHSKGPSFAVLEGLKGIPDDDAVLVTYCDYGMVWDARRFEWFVSSSNCDACLLSYRGFHAHYLNPQTYAYSRLEHDQVREVKEKGSFTSNREQEFASSGAYYFRTAALLRKAIAHQMDIGLALNGEYYTSLTVEALLRMQPSCDVRVFEIPGFFQWGTPQDLQDFEYWERTYAALNRGINDRGEVAQVLMPMAGKGSRFTSLTKSPKPFISVAKQPMYRSALRTLPKAKTTVFVGLDSFRDDFARTSPPASLGEKLILLAETPPGQALSTAAGLPGLDLGREVIVSSCDHGIAIAPDAWRTFHADPQCEAAIFTVRGYPLADLRPKAFAYVDVVGTERFPRVQRVSVKEPLSAKPSQDPLLVGTFWFQSGSILKETIADLLARDLRVNGELYLDSVFNLLIAAGKVVRAIRLDGYINWGDPDALATALYWREIFFSQRADERPRLPGVKD